jgi:uncharacterized cysteine cluster protein YcgN (CxxCxxCC family)
MTAKLKKGGEPRSNGDGERVPFWRAKRLEELSPEEWESLCDRRGLPSAR